MSRDANLPDIPTLKANGGAPVISPERLAQLKDALALEAWDTDADELALLRNLAPDLLAAYEEQRDALEAAIAAHQQTTLLLAAEARRVGMLEALIADFAEDDPCEYDHHGCCQAHSLHERPCPHERARTLLPEAPR